MDIDKLIKFAGSSEFAGAVCADSRQLGKGDIFVAIGGSEVDGHDFISDALKKGAVWIVAQTDAEIESDNLVIVEDSARVLGLLAQAACGDPAKKLTNLAVTGTNGKTSICYIVRSIIQTAQIQCGLIGTIVYDSAADSGTSESATLTTPDAVTIARLMSEMAEVKTEYMVTEASSHALSQQRLAGIEFSAAAFTNLTGDHLDYHNTPEEYLAEKTKLFSELAPDATAVLNKQSPEAQSIAAKTKANILWYAVDEEADITATVTSMDANQTSYELAYKGQRRSVTTSMIGEHNISNQLAAAGLCFAAGFDIDATAAGISALQNVPGRLEPVEQGQEFSVFIDYAHTDDALKNVLSTLRPLCKNKLTVVFGCGGDRDKTKRPRMAKQAEAFADRIIVTSDNPRSESPDAIIDDILKGFLNPNAENILAEVDREKAIEMAIESAEKNDIILIAGKGHETYQIIGDEVLDFDDKETALRKLKPLKKEPQIGTN
jgi:UDP-N-acetylmuramoyl-L-alanyl-D-glutamate--2,6-diaminopimelate ligase